MRLRWHEPVLSALGALSGWLNTWAGLAAIVAGIGAQGFNAELKQYAGGWRVTFYPVGLAPSGIPGSAWERSPWGAVQAEPTPSRRA
jgi:hypothetical protein